MTTPVGPCCRAAPGCTRAGSRSPTWSTGCTGSCRPVPRASTVGAPVGLVRFVPESVEPAAAHADGLWGGDNDDRVDRGVARVQAMLGLRRRGRPGPPGRPVAGRPAGPGAVGRARHRAAVHAAALAGAAPAARADPGLRRALGHGRRRSCRAAGRGHRPRRGHLRAGPVPLRQLLGLAAGRGLGRPVAGRRAVVGERWPPRPVARFQVVGVDGRAWLMRCDGDTWWTEAQ